MPHAVLVGLQRLWGLPQGQQGSALAPMGLAIGGRQAQGCVRVTQSSQGIARGATRQVAGCAVREQNVLGGCRGLLQGGSVQGQCSSKVTTGEGSIALVLDLLPLHFTNGKKFIQFGVGK